MNRRARTEDAKSRISFLSLSPELRNQVYELALIPDGDGDGNVTGSKAIDVKSVRPNWCSSRPGWALQPALTKVSRQIRQETIPIYYGKNIFVTHCYIRDADPQGTEKWQFENSGFHWWRKMIGTANMDLVKHLDVRHVKEDGELLGPVSMSIRPGPEFLPALTKYFDSQGVTLPRLARHLALHHPLHDDDEDPLVCFWPENECEWVAMECE